MRVLITGAAGFIGGFLSRYCSEAGESVFGLDHIAPSGATFHGSFDRCDVRDAKRMGELVGSIAPDRIYHLAAQSYPTVSLKKPLETMEINAGGTINLMEAVRAAGIDPVVVVACSSAEYGLVAARDLPVREQNALLPLHPYGVSKVAQDLLAAQYFANYGMRTVRIRIFNTTGPGKTGDICSDFTRRAIEVELGVRESPIDVGTLTTRRAILDVRDMVSALRVAAERCAAGDVYNVGSTAIWSGAELIDAIRTNIAVPLDVRESSALVRKCDEPVIAGDTGKFRECTGWQPEITLAQTITDMLAWWREHLLAAMNRPPQNETVSELAVQA